MIFSNVNYIVLMCISLAVLIFIVPYKTYYIRKYVNKSSGHFLFNAGLSIVSAIVIFLINGCRLSLSPFTFIVGSLFGIITMLTTVFNTLALEIGPLSYTTVFVNYSAIFTALLGMLFFREKALTVSKYFGLFFMVLCIYYSVSKEDKTDKKVNYKWFFYCLLAMTFSTISGLTQKYHQLSSFKDELTGFLVIAFGFSFVCSMIVYLVLNSKEGRVGNENIFSLKSLTELSVLGLCVAIVNVLNLYLTGIVDSAVFFPIINGIPLMTAVIFSFWLFKEKLDKKQIFGLIIGMLGVVCLCF